MTLDATDAVASAHYLAISTRVSALTAAVIAAIHFNDEKNAWREKVHDEAEQRDLTAKRNAELACANCAPQASL